MARTFTGTANDEAATLTLTGNGAVAVYVKNAGDTNGLQVCVPAIHGTDFDVVAPGDVGEYRDPNAGIKTVIVQCATDETTDYTAGVTEGTA